MGKSLARESRAEPARRLLDLVGSLVGLVVLSPILLLVAVLIKLDTPGPVFFRALRVGLGGVPFQLWKFRTMVAEAPSLGPGITAMGDPRVTRVGRALRRTKIDELPQLVNVVRGEMSLVGPRPEDPRYVDKYTASQRRVLRVRPGITSPASVEFRNEEAQLHGDNLEVTYLEKILPRKLELELEYLETRTLASDVRLMFRTLLAVLCG